MAVINGDQNPANVNDILYGTPNGLNETDYIDGLTGNDTIYGLDGNDSLKGGVGNDTIYGGTGNDYILGGAGQDYLDGGDGIDDVDYRTFNGDAIYNLATGSANLISIFTETMLNFENIYAGGGNDLITGTAGNNLLSGGAGNDTIYGGDGSDSIYGNSGDDTIQGGLGQDYLYGGAGNDTADYTTFNGNATYDLEIGTANLGVFTETMLSFENIKTGAGNDTIYGVAGDPNNYNQRTGNNISAGGGNDIIYGSIGDDKIFGGAGDDFILGSAGNDFIQGGLGLDFLDGGSGGYDTVDYTTFSGNGTYNLRAGTAILTGAFTETMLNFENILAGAGNDTIYGVDGNYGGNGGPPPLNLLDGGAGNDEIIGGSGNDRIIGGSGNDRIIGGAGNDYIQGGLGQDYLDGGDSDNSDNGFSIGDTVDYTTFNGDGTYDLINGTANLGVFTETMLNFENILTGAGNDYISGTGGRNEIDGGAGNDSIDGFFGDDRIYGGAGDDRIDGGAGNDSINGGAGNDLFIFSSYILDGNATIAEFYGIDAIADFTKTQDKIFLNTGTFLNIVNPAGGLSFATAISDTAAAFSDAKIVFSTSSNTLFYNQNGAGDAYGPNGGAFATVTIVGGGVLDITDFTLT